MKQTLFQIQSSPLIYSHISLAIFQRNLSAGSFSCLVFFMSVETGCTLEKDEAPIFLIKVLH